MRRDIASALFGAFAAFLITLVAHPEHPDPRAPERAVAALPGVGAGWLDTLQRVAGPVRIDTVNALMREYYGGHLLGLYEPWHGLVNVSVNIVDYALFIRAGGGEHPLTIATPAGVTAHEFGHALQFALSRQGPLPAWAQDSPERFADRFARAMLALRGWDTMDPNDLVLSHYVRYRLLRSHWPDSARTCATCAPALPSHSYRCVLFNRQQRPGVDSSPNSVLSRLAPTRTQQPKSAIPSSPPRSSP